MTAPATVLLFQQPSPDASTAGAVALLHDVSRRYDLARRNGSADLERAQDHLATVTLTQLAVLTHQAQSNLLIAHRLQQGIDAVASSPGASVRFVAVLSASPALAADLDRVVPAFVRGSYPDIVASATSQVMADAALQDESHVADRVRAYTHDALKHVYGVYVSVTALESGIHFHVPGAALLTREQALEAEYLLLAGKACSLGGVAREAAEFKLGALRIIALTSAALRAWEDEP